MPTPADSNGHMQDSSLVARLTVGNMLLVSCDSMPLLLRGTWLYPNPCPNPFPTSICHNENKNRD